MLATSLTTTRSRFVVPWRNLIVHEQCHNQNLPVEYQNHHCHSKQQQRPPLLPCGVLDRTSTYNFFHFPHALQCLSQCWSFFLSKQQEILQSKNNNPAVSPPPLEFQCHVNLYQVAGFGSIDQDWRASLVVDLMQCTHSYGAFDYSDMASRNQVVPWSLSSFTSNQDATRTNNHTVAKKGCSTNSTLPPLVWGCKTRTKTVLPTTATATTAAATTTTKVLFAYMVLPLVTRRILHSGLDWWIDC